MQRLGIMGGTFDPIHCGHVLLALYAQEHLQLDEVLFVPAADPPHKEHRTDLAPAHHRWAMVELAIAGISGFSASRLELDRPGRSYTIDTLRQLAVTHPDCERYLIIGEDNVVDLSSWHDPRGILEQCTVVAGSRITQDGQADPELASRMLFIDTPVVEISSTDIRESLRQRRPIRCMVPDSVEAYVLERRLYRAPAP